MNDDQNDDDQNDDEVTMKSWNRARVGSDSSWMRKSNYDLAPTTMNDPNPYRDDDDGGDDDDDDEAMMNVNGVNHYY